MLTVKKLTYCYQQQAMCFDFSLMAGERVAILGPSGAGKSSLLSLIAGFLPAISGSLLINNIDYTHTHPSQRPISMLFQENNLFPHLTVEQNIGLGLHPGLKLTSAQKNQILKIAEQTGLSPYLKRLPDQLSGGQRQRVALARCLLRNKPLLLLDEPFSSLDPALRSEMLQLLDEMSKQHHFTLLMVSHHIDDAAYIADRTLLILEGQVYYDGSTHKLLNRETPEADILHFAQ